MVRAEVPDDVVYITVGVDSQRDRYEIRMWGWTADEQAYLIDKIVVMGKYDDPDTLQRTEKALKVTYRKADGQWRIAHWRLRYDRLDPLPRPLLPDSFHGRSAALNDPEYVKSVVDPNGT